MLGQPHQFVNVYGYSPERAPIAGVPLGTTATVWINPKNGQAFLLVLHQSLFFGDRMPNSLLSPNQLRSNGLIVNDVPLQFSGKHSIVHPTAELEIPLYMNSSFSYFETHKPSDDDLEHLVRVELTSDTDWMSYKDTLRDNEPSQISSLYTATTVVEAAPEYSSADYFPDEHLYTSLVSCVRTELTCQSPSDSSVVISDVRTAAARPYLSPAILAKRWSISLDAATTTLNVTTQTAVRNVHLASERKVRIKAPWLQFPSIKGEFYVDSLFSKVTALHGFTGGSIYTNGSGYDRFYPWTRKGEHPNTLTTLFNDVGIPQVLISDNAKEELQGRAREICKKYHVHQKPTVPHSPWQNAAEASIRELKKNVRRTLRRTGAPLRLWAYCAIYCTSIRRLTASSLTRMNGRTPEEFISGSTPDISAFAMFDWYQPVYYWTPTVEFPNERKLLGRWLGIAESCTDDMAFSILTKSGNVIIRKSIWGLTNEELRDPTITRRLKELDDSINHRIGDDTVDTAPPDPDDVLHPGEDEGLELPPNQGGSLELHDVTPEELDEYLSKELLIPRGGDMVRARVLKRTRDGDGIPIGRRHHNPILDTRQYEVEFPDGSVDMYTANTIAENLYSQVDPETQSHTLFKGIVDHRKRTPSTTGTSQTTRGWEMCVEWTDGTTTWLPLKDLRDSNPIETAEYAVAHNLFHEKAFKHWARKTLKRRDAYIGKVKTRYWKRTHKYGIELPKSVKDALAIDAETGTTFWRDAIAKEMKNVSPAFEFRDDDVIPPGYTKIDCHMIFDIKVDLTRKARLVGGGHQTEVPKESVYSSVVSRDSVRIALLLATRNGLKVLSADVQNAYLNALTKEKCYTIAGPEFGSNNVGRPVIIVRALYGLSRGLRSRRLPCLSGRRYEPNPHSPNRRDARHLQDRHQQNQQGRHGRHAVQLPGHRRGDERNVADPRQSRHHGNAEVQRPDHHRAGEG